MGRLIVHWRVFWLVIIASNFYLQQTACLQPGADQVQIVELPNKNALKSGHTVTQNESSQATISVTEKRQRFCLNRLIEAMKIVCSGSGRIPHYFDPNKYPNVTMASHEGVQRVTRNIPKDVAKTTAQPTRHLLRRRSRRNIVRECCNNPCSYSNLLKYCSPSIRLSPSLLQPSVPIRHPLPLTKSRNGRLSRAHNGTNSITARHQLSCFPNCKYENNLDETLTASNSQCVSFADLNTFYQKFLQKQWKKGDEQTLLLTNNDITKSNAGNSFLPDSTAHLNEITNNAYSIATNRMLPNHFLEQANLHNLNPTVWQSLSTELIPIAKERIENLIGTKTEPERQQQLWGSNVITAKPIPNFISLPRGTNDDLY